MRKFIIGLSVVTNFIFAQPTQNRILIATSQDGLNWQKLNIIATDSGDVPDAVIGPSGAVFLFHQGLITPYIDGIKVGVSQNGINNWQFYQVQIPGTANWPGKPCDPDVIMFGDTFRLYFTGDPINDGHPETYSAVSLDGINFVRENGVRFEVLNNSVLDPSLLRTCDTLQYFAGGAPAGQNWHAYSLDGLNFIQQPNFSIAGLMMANGITVTTGGYRFYCFNNLPNDRNISSIFSTDGQNWMLEVGYRLLYDSTNPLEYLYIKDPAVVYKDSIYIMYYVSRKRPTAVKEINYQTQMHLLNIFPNPASRTLAIASPLLKNYDVKVKVYNALGRTIKEINSLNKEQVTINISEKGIFFIVVESTNFQISRIVIIYD